MDRGRHEAAPRFILVEPGTPCKFVRFFQSLAPTQVVTPI